MKDVFFDDDLGKIIVRRNSRAKRLIARRRENCVYLTVPSYYSANRIMELFTEMKPRLLSLEPRKPYFFDENTQFDSATFTLKIVRHSLQNYYFSLKEGVLFLSCPDSIDLGDDAVQQKIKGIVESVLRSEAKRFLPLMLEELSTKYGFTYSQVKINKSRTRWGSCSSKKNINLSYFCMLLPVHLIEFVLLHELCHTVEMNHGAGFWQLLDKVTEGKAKEQTRNLKRVSIGL